MFDSMLGKLEEFAEKVIDFDPDKLTPYIWVNIIAAMLWLVVLIVCIAVPYLVVSGLIYVECWYKHVFKKDTTDDQYGC